MRFVQIFRKILDFVYSTVLIVMVAELFISCDGSYNTTEKVEKALFNTTWCFTDSSGFTQKVEFEDNYSEGKLICRFYFSSVSYLTGKDFLEYVAHIYKIDIEKQTILIKFQYPSTARFPYTWENVLFKYEISDGELQVVSVLN